MLEHQRFPHMSSLKAKFSLLFGVRAFPLLAFIIPLVVRAIPEILMGSFIVGFDTLGYYVPNTLTWLSEGVGFWNFLATAPLFYMLLMGVTSVGVPIVIALKVLAPLLLGLLGVAVYFYANKTLSWSPRKSLVVALFATLYFVALRISWDMLRSELGLIFLFTSLIFLSKSEGSSFRSGALLSLSMLGVVLAHQLVAVIMFFIILVTLVRLFLDGKKVDLGRLVVCSVPAGFMFLLIVYANYVVSSSFSLVNGFLGQDGGFMALFGFSSHSELVVDTLGFLVFCYLPLLPLVFLGARRFRGNLHLKGWVVWVFFALLLVLVSPNASFLVFPYRWVLLLVYPLVFFAVEGFVGLRLNLYKLGFGLMLATFSLAFIVLPNSLAFPYYTGFPLYVPTSMLQNTVSLSDCQDTVNVLQWMETNVDDDGFLLAHDAFYGWASLTLDADRLIRYGYESPEVVAQELVENGSESPLYLVWWVDGSGWHGQSAVSSVFGEVYESGNIALYAYDSGVFQ
jgi:hypothetical protein